MGQKRLRALERLWNTLQTSNYFKSMTCELSPCPSTYAAISRILCRWSRGTSASSRSVALPEDQEKLCDCTCCKHFENSLKPSAQCPGFPRFSEVFILLRLFLVRVQWEWPPRPPEWCPGSRAHSVIQMQAIQAMQGELRNRIKIGWNSADMSETVGDVSVSLVQYIDPSLFRTKIEYCLCTVSTVSTVSLSSETA